MSIWRLVTVLLHYMVLFLNNDLNLSSECTFIHSTFVIRIDHCTDTTMTLTQCRRQHSPCPYGLMVGKTDIKQIIINIIVLQKGKWHVLGKHMKIKSPHLPWWSFLDAYMDESGCEAYFGLKHEMESSPVLKQMNQQTNQFDLRGAQTSKISRSISKPHECFFQISRLSLSLLWRQ